MRSKIQYLGRSFHIAYSNKLDELIQNIYRIWSFFGFLPHKMAKMTKPNKYSEPAHRAYLNEYIWKECPK